MKLDIQFTTPAAAAMYSLAAQMYATPGACAFDLRACVDHTITLLPSEQVIIPTGIQADLSSLREDGAPDYVRFAAMILPRSGRGSKEGLCIANTVGLIDQDYQKEILVTAWARPTSGHINVGNARVGGSPIHIEPGERIAQLVITPVLQVGFNVVDAFAVPSERCGFGSTGKA